MTDVATVTTADLPCARPRTLADALAQRAAHPDWLVVAGGTDLMVGAVHRAPPPGVLDVFGLPGLAGVTRTAAGLRIGSGTTYARLLADEHVRRLLPVLREACAEVGALQIQARGTLGGNVATSSPVGDTLPCLLALDAEIVLASAARGERRVPYHAFCTGYRKVDLRPDELIVALEVPAPAPGAVQVWRKVGTRKAQAISKVMLAAVGHRDAQGRVAKARVALGAVADRPVRLRAVEDLLVGERPDEALALRAEAAVRAAITPITDVRSTKEYRLDVAARLVAGFVRALAAPEAAMREALALAARNVQDGGGPFGAVVVRDGVVVSRGWNQVTSTNDPTAHAEVVAIRSACKALGTFSLAGHELVTSCEPCPMCLSAAYWARVDRIWFSGTRRQAAAAGFSDDAIYEEIPRPLEERALPIRPLLPDEGQAPFDAWARKQDRIPY